MVCMHNIIEDDSKSLIIQVDFHNIPSILNLFQGEGRAAMCKAVCIIVMKWLIVILFKRNYTVTQCAGTRGIY